jgi:predicted ATPase
MRLTPVGDALIERFSIRGLYGYKDLSIYCRGAVTIIAAENGTGKTTLLNALNAFLTRRFHRLASIPFSRIECKFFGQDEIVLDGKSLGEAKESNSDILQNIASTAGVTENEVVEYIQSNYRPEDFDSNRRSGLIYQFYINSPEDYSGVKRHFDLLHSEFNSGLTDEVKLLSNKLRAHLENYQVLFLPTYRRIEKPLLRPARRREIRTPNLRSAKYAEGQPYGYEGMAFGLGDVEARLKEISEEIERASNLGYRALSARILNDMLRAKSSRPQATDGKLPDSQSLSRFLGRIGRVENDLGGLFSGIDSLYSSKKIYDDEYDTLRYFLQQLNSVIEQTQSMEQGIERFVDVCNSYLTMSSDEKSLEYDPQRLKVIVRNSWSTDPVSLDALSSGEKQIVSLMAKLYLDPGAKLVLVDEPEISLSIEWQRKVLPDVMSSGSVAQLVAITHSPFIFENELDRFASELTISKTRSGG